MNDILFFKVVTDDWNDKLDQEFSDFDDAINYARKIKSEFGCSVFIVQTEKKVVITL